MDVHAGDSPPLTHSPLPPRPLPPRPLPPRPVPARDARVETTISRLLTVGLALACGVTLLGGVLSLAAHHAERPDLHSFNPGEESLNSVGRIFRGVADLEPRAVTQLGVLLLIATPVARVALSLAAFALQRDRLYVAITLIVLALLVFSLFFGGHG